MYIIDLLTFSAAISISFKSILLSNTKDFFRLSMCLSREKTGPETSFFFNFEDILFIRFSIP